MARAGLGKYIGVKTKKVILQRMKIRSL